MKAWMRVSTTGAVRDGPSLDMFLRGSNAYLLMDSMWGTSDRDESGTPPGWGLERRGRRSSRPWKDQIPDLLGPGGPQLGGVEVEVVVVFNMLKFLLHIKCGS